MSIIKSFQLFELHVGEESIKNMDQYLSRMESLELVA